MSAGPLPLRPTCDSCHVWERKFNALLVDYDNLNADITVKRRQLTALTNRLAAQTRQDPRIEEIEDLFAYWRAACHHPRARLDDKRIFIIGNALVRYNVTELKQAIDGASHDAWVDAKGKRHDGIALIFRDADKIEDFMAREDAYQRGLQQSPRAVANALTAWHTPVYDNRLDMYLFPCPVCKGVTEETSHPLRVRKGAEQDMFCMACPTTFKEVRKWLLAV